MSNDNASGSIGDSASEPLAPEPSALTFHDWHFTVDQEGIGWAVFDREGQSANALGTRPLEELGKIVEWAEEGARLRTMSGLVILSGKDKGFIVGADINEFDGFTTEAEVIDRLRMVLALFDRIERLSIPVVAGIHGVCVGGGLELALACHYRIATRDEGTRVGFPEV
jgi:3-hydroxyacyl-CoA dehydrogenase/enoyl-CoA hydratase/3-hydroxybutyryl-CoA epimerase